MCQRSSRLNSLEYDLYRQAQSSSMREERPRQTNSADDGTGITGDGSTVIIPDRAKHRLEATKETTSADRKSPQQRALPWHGSHSYFKLSE